MQRRILNSSPTGASTLLLRSNWLLKYRSKAPKSCVCRGTSHPSAVPKKSLVARSMRLKFWLYSTKTVFQQPASVKAAMTPIGLITPAKRGNSVRHTPSRAPLQRSACQSCSNPYITTILERSKGQSKRFGPPRRYD